MNRGCSQSVRITEVLLFIVSRGRIIIKVLVRVAGGSIIIIINMVGLRLSGIVNFLIRVSNQA